MDAGRTIGVLSHLTAAGCGCMLRLRLRLGATTWSKRWCQAGGRVQLVAAAWIRAACCDAVFHAGIFALGSFRGGQPQVEVDGAVSVFDLRDRLLVFGACLRHKARATRGAACGGRSSEQVRADQ